MAAGPITQVADIIVPEIFTSYVQQVTEEKSRIIASGALVRDAALDELLMGGGVTFNTPSFKDLDNDADNISTDEEDVDYGGAGNSTPKKTGTSQEISVRLSRNQSWSSADLASALAGEDPMLSIANRVGYYWSRRLQAAFVATMAGIFADNDAAPVGSEHVQFDMTNDIKGASYSAGVTDFNTAAFIDAAVTMGDSMEDLGLLLVHSIVYSRMQKNNLIDFIPDSEGRVIIPTYLGRSVVVDDGLPSPSSGVYESWLFGRAAVRLGVGSPKVPTEVQRKPDAANGGGQEILHNRLEWIIHPTGNKYAGTPANGGPSNAATANNLANAGSWQRVYPERKQIKIARLVTREF